MTKPRSKRAKSRASATETAESSASAAQRLAALKQRVWHQQDVRERIVDHLPTSDKVSVLLLDKDSFLSGAKCLYKEINQDDLDRLVRARPAYVSSGG